MELYIDLSKGRMNTAKLVKKPVQVRGKNGKVYTRMQWVDPRTGQPVSEGHHPQADDNVQHKTQKDHIDAHIKKMSREEKYAHLKKHGITWKPNDHEAIDHKNAMMALKEHFYKNPHLAGAEHLPKDADPKAKGDLKDQIHDFSHAYKKHPELLYKMMHHLGVIGDPTDPRTVDGQQHPSKGGNGMGDIAHMKNMMAFKKHLTANPHHMDEMKAHPEFGKPHGATTSAKTATPTAPKPTPTTQTKAQKGGNTIKGILDTMPREEKYKLLKHLGITDRDPTTDPSIDPKMAPIQHMKYMMELKKAVEKDPSLLNINPDTGGISEDEKNRLAGLSGKEKLAKDAKDFLDRASRQLKLEWADSYADHEHMKNRDTNPHEHIDNMHKIAALKKIIMDNPDLMKELGKDLEREELSNLKIGNKMMAKILREVAGLKGVGDLVAGYDKGREWEFGDESTAMIQEDDEGEPILSIFHVDKEGKEHDLAIPMKKVKAYLDGLKSGDKVEVKPQEVPLHKKTPKAMVEALNEDFDKHYTPQVGEAMKMEISKLWESNKVSAVGGLEQNSLNSTDYHLKRDTIEKLLSKYGVDVEDMGILRRIDVHSDAFKRVVWGHLVEKSKTKDAHDYITKDGMSQPDTWVLHESAKHWTPDERSEARREIINKKITIENMSDYDNDPNMSGSDRLAAIQKHTHTSLEPFPFDLMSDVFIKGNCKISFRRHNSKGEEHWGNYFSPGEGIVMSHVYVHDDNTLKEKHPLYHKPHPTSVTGQPTASRGHHPFSDTMAHEFAHAIDNHLSGGGMNDYVQWGMTKHGKKYSGKHANVVEESYRKAVDKTNPGALLKKARNGNVDYYFHLDNWMSNYEGRIYRQPNAAKDAKGQLHDASWSKGEEVGLEHWSENVSRVMNAFHAYKNWRDREADYSTDMKTWARLMSDDFKGEGYGSDNERDKYLSSYREERALRRYPEEAYGHLYHTMSVRHPELFKAIHDMVLRPDFVGDTSVSDPISRAERDDYTRKSEVDLIINL